MSLTNDIPTKLRVPAQLALDAKSVVTTLSELQTLGTNNNLAYTYYKGMEVLCSEDLGIYRWRPVNEGETGGTLPSNFTYPAGIVSEDGVVYSNIAYNFFKETTLTVENFTELVQINNVGEGVEIYKDSTIVGDNTQFNFRSLTSTGGSITITQGADAINLEVEIEPTGICLTSKDKTVTIAEVEGCFDLSINLPTSVNVGTGEDVYKTFNVFTNQNEFKTLKSNNNTIGFSPSTDELSLEVNNLQKTINTFPYTLVDSDDKYTIFIDNGASNVVINVPDGLIDNFSTVFIQEGTGTVTIQQSGTATLLYPSTTLQNIIKGQYYWAMVEKKLATNTYYLLGSLLTI